jgi:hypothetical protein
MSQHKMRYVSALRSWALSKSHHETIYVALYERGSKGGKGGGMGVRSGKECKNKRRCRRQFISTAKFRGLKECFRCLAYWYLLLSCVIICTKVEIYKKRTVSSRAIIFLRTPTLLWKVCILSLQTNNHGKKNAVFWDVTPCGSCKNRRFWVTYLTACFICQILLTLLLHRRFLSLWWRRRYFPPNRRFLQQPTRRNIPEEGILHSHRRESLKSYIALTC